MCQTLDKCLIEWWKTHGQEVSFYFVYFVNALTLLFKKPWTHDWSCNRLLTLLPKKNMNIDLYFLSMFTCMLLYDIMNIELNIYFTTKIFNSTMNIQMTSRKGVFESIIPCNKNVKKCVWQRIKSKYASNFSP